MLSMPTIGSGKRFWTGNTDSRSPQNRPTSLPEPAPGASGAWTQENLPGHSGSGGSPLLAGFWPAGEMRSSLEPSWSITFGFGAATGCRGERLALGRFAAVAYDAQRKLR